MHDAAALAQLRDIHLPLAISWWPPAPGWWVLGLLVISGLIMLSCYVIRYWQRTRAKRQALQLLSQYEAEYTLQGDAVKSAGNISSLLRRVALAYYPRQQVAGLQGKEWIDFLNSHARAADFSPLTANLLELPYQNANSQPVDLQDLFKLANHWIKQRGSRCSH